MDMITATIIFLVYSVSSMWILIGFLWPLVQKFVKVQGFFGNVLRYGLLFILNVVLQYVLLFVGGGIFAGYIDFSGISEIVGEMS